MNGTLIVDTNLLLLIVVGSVDRALVENHKRLKDFTAKDYDFLSGTIVPLFEKLVIVPNVLTEVANLSRHVGLQVRQRDAARLILQGIRNLAESATEVYVPSSVAVQCPEFLELGLTDAVLLTLSTLDTEGDEPTLLTVDEELFDRALSNGYSVLDYTQLRP